MRKNQPKTINISLGSDADEINDNFLRLSRTLGYKINKTKLLKHILKNCDSKHSLYSLGFISFQELHTPTTFKRGGKDVRLKPLRMTK